MPILTLPDTDIAYEVRGSGEPLVLLPGFASGAWSWDWQIDELGKVFQIITFDPRGVARSELKADSDESIAKIADDVAELLTQLKSTLRTFSAYRSAVRRTGIRIAIS